LVVAIIAVGSASACSDAYSPRASFAPGNYLSMPPGAGASQLVESPFQGRPSTGSELTSPPPIPGSPSTALR